MQNDLSYTRFGAMRVPLRNRIGIAAGKHLLALALMAALAPAIQAADYSQQAINNADSFLRTPERGRDILSYIHFGADYHGHRYLRTLAVEGSSDDFALVYRFKWEDDGVTDAAFLCNRYGVVYEVRIVYTNAILSQPFLLANASIKVLGHTLINLYRDKLSDEDQRQLHKLVNDADAKGLLEWSLRLQQVLL